MSAVALAPFMCYLFEGKFSRKYVPSGNQTRRFSSVNGSFSTKSINLNRDFPASHVWFDCIPDGINTSLEILHVFLTESYRGYTHPNNMLSLSWSIQMSSVARTSTLRCWWAARCCWSFAYLASSPCAHTQPTECQVGAPRKITSMSAAFASWSSGFVWTVGGLEFLYWWEDPSSLCPLSSRQTTRASRQSGWPSSSSAFWLARPWRGHGRCRGIGTHHGAWWCVIVFGHLQMFKQAANTRRHTRTHTITFLLRTADRLVELECILGAQTAQ